MTQKILITGASGMIARALSASLSNRDTQIRFLTANKDKKNKQNHFFWNIPANHFDENCLDGVTDIIHLAGAGIADRAWTKSYRQSIRESRIRAASMIFEKVQQKNIRLRSFISASGIGFYPPFGHDIQNESTERGDGFVADVCCDWEAAAMQFAACSDKVCCIRTGLVLSSTGGFLKPFDLAMRWGVLPVFGNGSQYLSWIHIDDLVKIYLRAVDDPSMAGVWNATAPNPVTQREMNSALLTAAGKKGIQLPMPAIVVKAIFGQRAVLLLGSQKVLPQKLLDAGFVFQFPELMPALKNLYER
jgi:uncharacterized protein